MAKNFHGAVEFVCEGSLKFFAPGRCFRWKSAVALAKRGNPQRKTNGREIEPPIKPASAVKADFLRIEFVEIVQHSTHGKTLVVVERVLELTEDNSTTVDHQIFSDNATGVREAVGKLFVSRKHEQPRSLCAVGA